MIIGFYSYPMRVLCCHAFTQSALVCRTTWQPRCWPGVLPILYILSHVNRPKLSQIEYYWLCLVALPFEAMSPWISVCCGNIQICRSSITVELHFWTKASHRCFDSSRYCRTVSFGVCIKCSASWGSCWAPPLYTVSIWTSAAKCRICCWSGPPEWSSLLQWSHISHDMSHSFWINADVHQWLDLHEQTWLQILSCWLLQYGDNHPPSSLSHHICFCLSCIGVEGCLGSGCISWDHALRFANTISHKTSSVPCACSHCLSFSKLVFHCCLAPGAGHCKMLFVFHLVVTARALCQQLLSSPLHILSVGKLSGDLLSYPKSFVCWYILHCPFHSLCVEFF